MKRIGLIAVAVALAWPTAAQPSELLDTQSQENARFRSENGVLRRI